MADYYESPCTRANLDLGTCELIIARLRGDDPREHSVHTATHGSPPAGAAFCCLFPLNQLLTRVAPHLPSAFFFFFLLSLFCPAFSPGKVSPFSTKGGGEFASSKVASRATYLHAVYPRKHPVAPIHTTVILRNPTTPQPGQPYCWVLERAIFIASGTDSGPATESLARYCAGNDPTDRSTMNDHQRRELLPWGTLNLDTTT